VSARMTGRSRPQGAGSRHRRRARSAAQSGTPASAGPPTRIGSTAAVPVGPGGRRARLLVLTALARDSVRVSYRVRGRYLEGGTYTQRALLDIARVALLGLEVLGLQDLGQDLGTMAPAYPSGAAGERVLHALRGGGSGASPSPARRPASGDRELLCRK